jgi:hypothetical protein
MLLKNKKEKASFFRNEYCTCRKKWREEKSLRKKVNGTANIFSNAIMAASELFFIKNYR